MIIINNIQEFESFYPYDKKYINESPKEFPCVCKLEDVDGGLCGDYRQVYVSYFPKNTTPNDSFIIGLNNPWEILK